MPIIFSDLTVAGAGNGTALLSRVPDFPLSGVSYAAFASGIEPGTVTIDATGIPLSSGGTVAGAILSGVALPSVYTIQFNYVNGTSDTGAGIIIQYNPATKTGLLVNIEPSANTVSLYSFSYVSGTEFAFVKIGSSASFTFANSTTYQGEIYYNNGALTVTLGGTALTNLNYTNSVYTGTGVALRMSGSASPTHGHINAVVISNTIGVVESIYADNAGLLYKGPWAPVQGSGASSAAFALSNSCEIECWINGCEDTLVANFNVSGCSAGQYPDVIFEVDGVQGPRTTLTSTGQITGVFPFIPPSGGISTSTFTGHHIRLIMANIPDGSGNGWTGSGIWQFNSFTLDQGTTLITPQTQKPVIVWLMDSIGNGENMLRSGSLASGQDSLLTWPKMTCEMLGFECKSYTYSGNGLVLSGLGTGFTQFGVPIFVNSFGFAASGIAYTTMSPIFSFLGLGTNDHGQSVSPATFQAAYQAAITQILTAYPNTIIIPCLLPSMVLGSPVASYASAVNAAITAVNSPQCLLSNLLDLSTALPAGTTTDGVHPNPTGHAILFGLAAAKVVALISSYNLSAYVATATTQKNSRQLSRHGGR